MRCPDCNKFVGLDSDSDPEVDNLEIDDEGRITGSVLITNNCIECGTGLADAQLDIDVQAEVAEHVSKDNCSLSVDEKDSPSRETKSDGKGRYTRTYYGARASFLVSCECGFETETEWEEFVQASHMDQLN